jgi:outer membrane lipopolysaccharide assembly protein LptE/RlpB
VAKEAEEAMLVKEMQTEIVRQILRQLATVRVEGKP